MVTLLLSETGRFALRYLVGLAGALALLALPLGVSAQADEEPSSQEPSSEAAREEPTVQLQLDDAGVEVVPSPPRTADGYTLEEMDARVRRAAIGLGVSGLVFSTGVVLAGLGVFSSDCYSFSTPKKDWCDPVAYTGAALTVGGVIAVIATGVTLGTRKTERYELRQAHHETPRRVQWDLARSRLVF